MKKTLSKISLYIWLTVAVVSAAFLIGGAITNGWNSVQQYVLIPLIALAMFFFRRFLHKRISEEE